MTNTLRNAGLNADQVDYVNAHGTSTPLGDVAETVAVKRAFGEHAKKLAVSSTKSMHGHLLGGAGALEMAVTLLPLLEGVIPPTAHLEDIDPGCTVRHVPGVAQRGDIPRAVMSNSFAFGGSNVVLIAEPPAA